MPRHPALEFGFTHVEIPVSTAGLTLTVEILNPEGGSLGSLTHNVDSGLKLHAAADGLANQIRERFGVGSRVTTSSEAADAPVTLLLDGGYRFGAVTQRRFRGSAVYARGSTLRVRRSGD